MASNEVSHTSSTTTFTTISHDNTLKQVSARSYQIELVEQAKSENLIVCLPTGSGKTFIAVMLIKEWLPTIRPSLEKGGKRTILLVKTVELARQHHSTLIRQVDLKDFEIGIYCGPSKISLQDSNRWNSEFENHPILIFTAQIFLNLLIHNRFSLDRVNLLIFDECHHATGNDQYATIMKDYYDSCRNRPRILGLTASISGQKIEADKLPKVAKQLENIFHARIETGSDRIEINRNSTSVKARYERCSNYEQKIHRHDTTVVQIFKEIKLLYDELDNYLKTKRNQNEVENNPSTINDRSNSIQLQCRTLAQLKSHLDNNLHIGYDLGLYGFSLGIRALTKYLKTTNAFITMVNPIEKELYNRIIQKLDNLIDEHLTNLTDNHDIRFSDKVNKVKNFIKENKSGQSIIFVERVYTAAYLSQVLNEILGDSFQVKHLAGSKAYMDGIKVSTANQRDVAKNFRNNNINVLVSTAIVEEGLDVPACNLVIRFNKPQNFSSYMQSKGRARAKETQALFVLLNDEHDLDAFIKNKEEYKNYEEMEKMLKRNFKSDSSEDTTYDNDCTLLEPYRPEKGVKINGIRAVQIIYQYCAVNGNGQILSPRFCFYTQDSNKFKCILSMPGNCPIREDIICVNSNKKVAKQECCLNMVEKLHIIGELDSSCLPIRPERDLLEDESSDDNGPKKASLELIDKQIAHFPFGNASLRPSWHLYRIKIFNNDELGFLVPSKKIKVPVFKLHADNSESTVEVIYLKPIDFNLYEQKLEIFCRYIFEEVFDKMIKQSESILIFDIECSKFKLLPCLLKKSGDIDCERMASIYDRKNKVILNPSELNDQEVYYNPYSNDQEFYRNITDDFYSKRASDRWEHEKKPVETVKSFADHFEKKRPDIQIRRDFLMATLKNYRRPKINYLNNSPMRKEKQSILLLDNIRYYPIEYLRYAPLNQTDYELIYRLPSILVRISQLCYIEELRKLLADNIQSYSLLDIKQMPIVTFDDCLTNIFSLGQSTALPLISLNYDLLINYKCTSQPSFGLLFQSITRHSTAESTDMENLEILGDCFLKLAMSMSLYHKYPFDHSGKLTSKKDRQVSNKNLYRLATEKNLKNYLYVNEIKLSGKEANWLLPGYEINDEQIDEERSERYMKQRAKRKAFADMIEALIGAFLVSTDYSTTIKFMNWLGLTVIPIDDHGQMMKTPSILCSGLSDTMNQVISGIQQLYTDRAFHEIEKVIKYDFKNRAYLISAFTHASYCNNHLTQCYERLEYLGDAILDYLVVRCIFVEHYDRVTPSLVTNIRQDLSNNGRLAYILVSCDIEKKILHSSPYLFNEIPLYLADKIHFVKGDQSLQDKLNKDTDQWADSTAPKALADVFEALVGAIFLDSGYSLETVWKIIQPLLRQYIDRSVKNPILNPVRAFYENQGKILKRTYDDDGYFSCYVQLPNGREIKGRGKNQKLAKYNACLEVMKTS